LLVELILTSRGISPPPLGESRPPGGRPSAPGARCCGDAADGSYPGEGISHGWQHAALTVSASKSRA
jgi:hypothetical protein